MMTRLLIFLLLGLSSPALADEIELMRETLETVSHKIYQREKKIIVHSLAKIEDIKANSQDFTEYDYNRLLAFSSAAFYPIVSNFPSKVFEEKVLPTYVDALDQIFSVFEVSRLSDFFPEPPELIQLAVFILQEGVKYSEFLFHDDPQVISEKMRFLADFAIALQSNQLDCEALEGFDELDVITEKLMANPDVDRTKGVALMIEAILQYFSDVQELLPCK